MSEEIDYMMEKKIELLIDMKVKKLQEELQIANGKVAQVTEELSTLKNKVKRMDNGVETQTRLAPEPVQQTLAQEKQIQTNQQPPVAQATNQQSNSRTGAFTPGDVSIEKMFYFGNKA